MFIRAFINVVTGENNITFCNDRIKVATIQYAALNLFKAGHLYHILIL